MSVTASFGSFPLTVPCLLGALRLDFLPTALLRLRFAMLAGIVSQIVLSASLALPLTRVIPYSLSPFFSTSWPFQKDSSISVTQYSAPIVASGSERHHKSALRREVRRACAGVRRQEPKQIDTDRGRGRRRKSHGRAESQRIGS